MVFGAFIDKTLFVCIETFGLLEEEFSMTDIKPFYITILLQAINNMYDAGCSIAKKKQVFQVNLLQGITFLPQSLNTRRLHLLKKDLRTQIRPYLMRMITRKPLMKKRMILRVPNLRQRMKRLLIKLIPIKKIRIRIFLHQEMTLVMVLNRILFML